MRRTVRRLRPEVFRCLVSDFAVVRALALPLAAALWVGAAPAAPAQTATVDYDVDDDGLIEIATLARLDAVRHDLDGDGAPTAAGAATYAAAFPDAAAGMGCDGGCAGYELTADLDFDTDGSGAAGAGDAYWNGGAGWTPIGDVDSPFDAIFEGNVHTLANLFVDRFGPAGLFARTGTSSVIRHVGVVDADVSGRFDADVSGVVDVGGLVGRNKGAIRDSYATGRMWGSDAFRGGVGGLVGYNDCGVVVSSYAVARVAGYQRVGGLVGRNVGAVGGSYAAGRVSATFYAGGLVGHNDFGGAIVASYAAGSAVGLLGAGRMQGFLGQQVVGGLVGHNGGEISASYATGRATGLYDVGGLVGSISGRTDFIEASYWDTSTSGHPTGSHGAGRTTAALQAPTDYDGIYQGWQVDADGDGAADDLWDFGTAAEYPVLVADTDGDGAATWQEFGHQVRAGPTLAVTTAPSRVSLSWTAVDASPWSPAPSVTYAVIRHTGSTSAGVTVGEDLDGLQYVVDRPEGAYTYQVTAVVNGGEAARSGGGSVTVAAGDADRAPEAVGRLEDLRLLVEDGAVVVDIAGAFRDPDGDALTYEASSSSPSAVAVGLSGAALTITPLTPGAATITVAAPHSGSDVLATQRFLATAVVNGGPEALETLADRVLPLADGAVVVDISEAFRDPDGDALTYAAASSAPAVAAASLSGTALTIVPVALGAATITVTATDVGKSDTSGTQEFLVTVVPNRGPEAVGALADQFLVVSDAAGAVVEASAAFRDPDGDALTYTAVSSSPSVATVSVSGSAVTVVPVALGTATVTVTATDAGASNGSAAQGFGVTVVTADPDADRDGLIEVGSLAQLYAVRHDGDGDGAPTAAGASAYAAAFPDGGAGRLVCVGGCAGYELTADLDFDTDGSGAAGAGDAYWNGGAGWTPIGSSELRFDAIFEGNGHTIANLFIDQDGIAGLFGWTGTSSVIRHVGVVDADVSGGADVGGLVGRNKGAIRDSYATGRMRGSGGWDTGVGGLVGHNDCGVVVSSYAVARVAGYYSAGGLVGRNIGAVRGSYAAGRASATFQAGGLVGLNASGGAIVASYAAGSAVGLLGVGRMQGFEGQELVGGLAGYNAGEISASYATGRATGVYRVGGLVGSSSGGADVIEASYWDTSTSGHPTGSHGVGRTTAALQAPTAYAGIYAAWDADIDGDGAVDDPWEFGTASEYPALAADLDGDGVATWAEFGYQLRKAPTLTATVPTDEVRVDLAWTAADTSYWSAPPAVSYTLYRGHGDALEIVAEDLTGRQYADTDVSVGDNYVYQVAAGVHGGEAVRGAGVPVTVTPIGAVVPLTASFAAPTPGAEPVPASHDGSTAFTLRILFSEPIGISYATLRDESLQATGGTVRKAQRVGGRNDLWDIEVAPSSAADVVVVLPATSGCGAAAAVCTRDGKPLSHGLEATIPGTAPVPLTAEFRNVPSSHAGSGTFTLELSFSEPIAVSYRTLRDESLQATGGAVRKARRVNGSSKLWELEIAPSSSAEVVVVLPATSGCGAAAAVCTRDGQPLSNRVEAAIPGPPQPEVSIVAAAGPVTEAGASAFTLTRTGETAAALSVEVSVTETGAMLAAGAPTSVTFGAGASEQALSVGTDDDTVVEEASTVTVVVAAGAGYAVASGSGSAQVTVEDNDTAEFELSVDPAEIAEGESSTVTASIANGVTFASDQTIALEFTGTATKGTDYTVSAETLALSAGAGSASVTVTAVADEDEEDGETVEVAAEHGGAGIGGATVTISADEAPPPDDAAPEGFALAANENPHGAWSDGRLLWVADGYNRKLYAYRLSDGERVSSRDIAVEQAETPMGVWSDGETLWVADYSGGVLAYELADGSRKAERDLSASANIGPTGIWSDGETLWVAEWQEPAFYAYGLSDGERIADLDVSAPSERLRRTGIWSDGETLWVAEWGGRIYAYRMSDGAAVPGLEISTSEAGNDYPTGLWSNGTTLWVTEAYGGPVYVHPLPQAETADEESGPGVGEDDRLGEAGAGDAAVDEAGSDEPREDPALETMVAVAIPDAGLRAGIERALGKGAGAPVTAAEMAALVVLDLRGAGVADLTGLEHAVGLVRLDLGFNAVADLGPLASLTGLERLDIGGNGITDLYPLSGLSGLTMLRADGAGIADLGPLASLTGLRRLDIGGNAVTDLYPLSGLSGLMVLRADGNRIVDLAPLGALTRLASLDLGSNDISDLRPLAGLRRLRTLKLGGNAIADLGPLSGQWALAELDLGGNAITDLRPLSPLVRLKRLDIGGNPVEDLSPLEGLTALTVAGRDD